MLMTPGEVTELSAQRVDARARLTVRHAHGLTRIERLYQDVPKQWSRYVFSDHVATDLLPPKFGDASGVRGAAWLWPEES